MLFDRIEDLKIVDMCKYVDENVYRDDLTENDKNLIFKYLYFIVYSISKAHKILYYESDYDNFAIYLAEWLYFRLVNNEQNLPPIKSVKNYVDTVLLKRKIRWQLSEKYNTVFDGYLTEDDNKNKTFDVNAYMSKLRDEVDSTNTVILSNDVKKEIKDLPTLIDKVVEKTAYTLDEQVKHNLSISIMLTFINSLNKKNDVICWHLDSAMFKDYVLLLLRRVKRAFVENVNYLKTKNEVCEDIVCSMLREDCRGSA